MEYELERQSCGDFPGDCRQPCIRDGEREIMAHAEKIQTEIESGKGRLPVESDKAKIDALIAEVMKVAEVA